MNVIDGASLLTQITIWLAAAIAIVVAGNYFLRPRTRALYPGGNARYLTALLVQAAGFMIPIPFVLIVLMSYRLPYPGVEVIGAVVAGLIVIFGLRALPVTGPMLKDLRRARIEAVMERLGPRPALPERGS